jgi:hypothetical protein
MAYYSPDTLPLIRGQSNGWAAYKTQPTFALIEKLSKNIHKWHPGIASLVRSLMEQLSGPHVPTFGVGVCGGLYCCIASELVAPRLLGSSTTSWKAVTGILGTEKKFPVRVPWSTLGGCMVGPLVNVPP